MKDVELYRRRNFRVISKSRTLAKGVITDARRLELCVCHPENAPKLSRVDVFKKIYLAHIARSYV